MCHSSKGKRWQRRKSYRFDFPDTLTGWPTDASISHLNAPGSQKKHRPVCSDGKKKKTQPESNLEFGTLILDRRIIITEPIKLANEANSSEGWRKKNSRHKSQKNAVFVAMLPVKEIIKLPCILKVTRYAPKLLDRHDNLPYSCKWVMDQLCAEITGEHRPGRADNIEGFTFQYDQIKSKTYSTKIEISW